MIDRKVLHLFAVAFAVASLVVMVGCGDEKGVNPPPTPPPPTQFMILFDANGGSPSIVDTVVVDSGKALGSSANLLPADPTREWHEFAGWFTGTTQYTASTVITRNVRLTAKWTLVAVAGAFTDSRDGKTYNTVTINGAVWMAENLNYAVDSSWCYDENIFNCFEYGRLYNRDAAVSACQSMDGGWRLSTNDDWYNLQDDVGGGQLQVANKLKSKSGWSSDGNGTDEFGFSAMPGGQRNSDGSFHGLGNYGHWWYNDGGCYGECQRVMGYNSNGLGNSSYGGPVFGAAFSVRCVRNW